MQVLKLVEPHPRNPKLSDPQKEIFVALRDKKGSYLKTHRSFSGAETYRLMSSVHSPLCNVSKAVVDPMLESNVLNKVEI